jgi:hypothetical protein
MSWALVHSAVAEPCQVSPPSSSSAPGRLARRRLTRVAEVGEAADLAVGLAAFEIQVGEGMGLDACPA